MYSLNSIKAAEVCSFYFWCCSIFIVKDFYTWDVSSHFTSYFSKTRVESCPTAIYIANRALVQTYPTIGPPWSKVYTCLGFSRYLNFLSTLQGKRRMHWVCTYGIQWPADIIEDKQYKGESVSLHAANVRLVRVSLQTRTYLYNYVSRYVTDM